MAGTKGSKSTNKPKKGKNKSSSSQPEKKASTRKRVQTARAKASVDADSSDDSEDDVVEVTTAAEAKAAAALEDAEWTTELSFSLLTRINETAALKRSIFPPCGPNASTKDGGGMPKTHAYWDLAVHLLGNEPKYKEAMSKCVTAKQKEPFGNKIKNRLRK
ncbi:hypothetical protein R3P38DRAFT_2796007 [Favolaschia claudopus]|uniref:Uncharacterized protein n=1 Tax=Favolaschia claudopus TaxID=2862362 RepID=A0AAW0A6J0_9AGAR